jgi:hypothetical protein
MESPGTPTPAAADRGGGGGQVGGQGGGAGQAERILARTASCLIRVTSVILHGTMAPERFGDDSGHGKAARRTRGPK